MNGYAVLSPMGFDRFGLPAENAAIKTGRAPPPVHRRAHRGAAQLDHAHRRRLRLASRGHEPRPRATSAGRSGSSCACSRPAWPTARTPRSTGTRSTRRCWPTSRSWPTARASAPAHVVEKRDLEQWFFKITDYAEQLLDDLDELDWPEKVKIMQRNWIGRSEGAEFEMVVSDADGTPRADGAVGPGVHHPARHQLRHDLRGHGPRAPAGGRRSPTDEQRGRGRRPSSPRPATTSEVDRLKSEGALDKRGVFTGAYLRNPFTGDPVPLYLADYVLMGYGTGAIMAVPGQDQRDWDFATRLRPAHRAHRRSRPTTGRARRTPATACHQQRSGSTAWTRPRPSPRAIDWLEEQGIGERKVNYRLRDWLLSRQRFWGCPIPIVYCDDCGIRAGARRRAAGAGARRRRVPAHRAVAAAVPRGLPAHDLPDVRRSGPARDRHDGHVRRLVVVLPALLRPVERRRARSPGGGRRLDAGRPVHRRRRARHPAPDVRPLLHQGAGRPRRRAQGAARAVRPAVHAGHDPPRTATKMSKSKGNLVAPEEILDTDGADALRLAHLFVGPPQDDVDWEGVGIDGCARFLHRLWRLAHRRDAGSGRSTGDPTAADVDDRHGHPPADRPRHRRVRALVLQHRGGRRSWSSSTTLYEYVQSDDGRPRRDARRSPSTSCCCCWPRWRPTSPPSCGSSARGDHVHEQAWPEADPAMLAVDTVTMVVQVNGKVRDRARGGGRHRPPTQAEAAGAGLCRRCRPILDGAAAQGHRPAAELVNIVV